MKFEMNNRTWEIKELSEEELIKLEKELNEYQGATYIYGTTLLTQQVIYLSKDLCYEKKKQTLYHELMHVYIECFLCGAGSFDEEALCNIISCSNDLLHKIVKVYFNTIKIRNIVTPINNKKIKKCQKEAKKLRLNK